MELFVKQLDATGNGKSKMAASKRQILIVRRDYNGYT